MSGGGKRAEDGEAVPGTEGMRARAQEAGPEHGGRVAHAAGRLDTGRLKASGRRLAAAAATIYKGDDLTPRQAWVRRGSFVALLSVVLATTAVIAPGAVAGPQPFRSDDFNVVSLDLNRWTETDPVGDGSVAITDAGTGDAQLSLGVPAGTDHAPGANDLLRVTQEVPDEDVQLDARFTSVPDGPGQLQGVIVQAAADRYIRYGLEHDGSTPRLVAVSVSPDEQRHRLDIAVSEQEAAVLRVTREGNSWSLGYSADGLSWMTAATFVDAFALVEAGLYAGNQAPASGVPAPAHTALVDYAVNTADDFGPEDRPSTSPRNPDTTPPIVTNVAVEASGDSALVTWTTSEPSSSAVEYGTSESFGTSTGKDPFDTEHALTITDLSPDTTYYYRVRSTDPAGLEASTSPASFRTSAHVPSAPFVSDDFRGGVSPSLWIPVDPRQDGRVEEATESDDSCAAAVELTVPGGGAHDPWVTNDSLRLVQPLADADLDLAARFDSTPRERFQSHGLLIEQGPGEYLRYGLHSTGSEVQLYAATIDNGRAITRYSAPVDPDAARVVRLTRNGDSWTLRYSADGESWEEAVTFAQPMSVTYAGVFAGNNSSGDDPAPAYTAVVDWVFDMNTPIAPEDGGSECDVDRLETPVTGEGAVARSPNAASYPSGAEVTLTAVPEPGWVFGGWSGSETGATNPTTITMSGHQAPTANFVQDQTPPAVSDVAVTTTDTSATITWRTDDPSTSTVAFGTSTGYESGTRGTDELGVDHMVTVTGLTPEAAYHYRISSVNGAGGAADSGDLTFVTGESPAPRIEVWNGDQQRFGGNGQSQMWVNVLGNVSDPDGVRLVSYRLNGGPDKTLRTGSDRRRLYGAGDFNIELDYNDLNLGRNDLVITAIDGSQQTSVKTVVVERAEGNAAPLPWSTNWSGAGAIHDRAQPVDGHWALEGGTIRAVEPGYDRTIAFGDMSWSDYVVTTSVNVQSLAEGSGTSQSGAPLVGIGLRWRGHTSVAGEQPRRSWWPAGAFAWHRWQGVGRYELIGNHDEPVARFEEPQMQFGTTYRFKAQVRTIEGGAEFSYKAWQEGTPEPAEWQQTITDEDGPTSGGVLLVSHHVVANWGDVEVTPLTP